MESNDFCQLSRSLPVLVGFAPKIIRKKIHLRIHRLTFSFASCMPFLANPIAGSLLCIFCFIHLVDRDRPILPRDERLNFHSLTLLSTLAWQYVLEVRITASSFLEMVYLVWNDSYVSLPIPFWPKAKIFFSTFSFHFKEEISEWIHGIIPIYIDKKTEVQGYKTSYKTTVDLWTTWVWTVVSTDLRIFFNSKYYSTTRSMVGWIHG